MPASQMFYHHIAELNFSVLEQQSKTEYSPRGESVFVNVKVHELGDKSTVDSFKLGLKIKQLLTDPRSGFSHKLWVATDLQQSSFGKVHIEEEDGEIQILTPNFEAILDSSVVRFVNSCHRTKDIEEYLDAGLRSTVFKNSKFYTSVWFDYNPVIPDSMKTHANFLRFCHGLQGSSNPGENNLTHGHLSWIALVDNEYNSIYLDYSEIQKIGRKFNNAIFLHEKTLASMDKKSAVVKFYYEKNGYNEIKYSTDLNLIIMATEPTIANICAYVAQYFRVDFMKHSPRPLGLWMSEGLSNGAFYAF